MDLRDHLVLISLFCRLRNGRPETLCALSRVYLINCRTGHKTNLRLNILSSRPADQEFQTCTHGSKLRDISAGRAKRYEWRALLLVPMEPE